MEERAVTPVATVRMVESRETTEISAAPSLTVSQVLGLGGVVAAATMLTVLVLVLLMGLPWRACVFLTVASGLPSFVLSVMYFMAQRDPQLALVRSIFNSFFGIGTMLILRALVQWDAVAIGLACLFKQIGVKLGRDELLSLLKPSPIEFWVSVVLGGLFVLLSLFVLRMIRLRNVIFRDQIEQKQETIQAIERAEREAGPELPGLPLSFAMRVREIYQAKRYQLGKPVPERGVLVGSYRTDLHHYGVVLLPLGGADEVLDEERLAGLVEDGRALDRKGEYDSIRLLVVADDGERFGDRELESLVAALSEERRAWLSDTTIHLRTEAEVLDELVHFDGYLKGLIDRFENRAWPDIDNPEGKPLAKTWMEPNYRIEDLSENLRGNGANSAERYGGMPNGSWSDENEVEESADSVRLEISGDVLHRLHGDRDNRPPLNEPMDNWLTERSRRHMVVLADYGMGKSSWVFQWAAHLARRALAGKPGARIPIYLPLTGQSPRTDTDLTGLLASFIEREGLNADAAALRLLMRHGRVVVLLDGFDEMDLIGDERNRRDNLFALWRLGVQGNKLLFAGRPGYFPVEVERLRALKIRRVGTPTAAQTLHSTIVHLDMLTDDQVTDGVKAWFPEVVATRHLEWLEEYPAILELAKRPALLHILRESIDTVRAEVEAGTARLTAAYLLGTYADGWITREVDKARPTMGGAKARGLLIAPDRRERFSEHLAAWMFLNERTSVRPDELAPLYQQWFPEDAEELGWDNHQRREGLATDLRTCTFLVPEQGDAFRFANKPFYEYFLAKHLLGTGLRKEGIDRELCRREWSVEICRHLADLWRPPGGEEPRFQDFVWLTEVGEGHPMAASHVSVRLWRNYVNPVVTWGPLLYPLLRPFGNVRGLWLWQPSRVNQYQVMLFAGMTVDRMVYGETPSERRVARVIVRVGGTEASINSLFQKLNFERVDFGRIAFLGANLSGRNLRRANLSQVVFGVRRHGGPRWLRRLSEMFGALHPNLEGANLLAANLSRAELYQARIFGACLDGSDLSNADLGRCTTSPTPKCDIVTIVSTAGPSVMKGARLDSSHLHFLSPETWNFEGADLSDATIRQFAFGFKVRSASGVWVDDVTTALLAVKTATELSKSIKGASFEIQIDSVSSDFDESAHLAASEVEHKVKEGGATLTITGPPVSAKLSPPPTTTKWGEREL